jgi:hypothetical protein
MALDEPNDLDCQFDVDGFKFLVNAAFLEKSQPIAVDHNGYGYKVNLGVEVPLFREGALTYRKMRTSQVIDRPIQTDGAAGNCCNRAG